MGKLPIHIKIVLGIILFFAVSSIVTGCYTTTVNLYNSSKQSELEYTKLTQQQVSNYDGYYLAFQDKQTNANINKETFIQVTDIIMSARKDGQTLAWKWVTENQQIPYEEFTVFYKELSNFISIRYEDNMRIEREKQAIVNSQNLLLSQYPNNIINILLDIPKIKYKAGYISNDTKNRFK